MPHPIIRSTAVGFALAAALPAFAATPITGRWLVEDGSSIVAVGPCGGGVCGTVARVLKAPANAPKHDVANPDPALRNRPILGLPILTGFTDAGDDWRGRIYDPRDGKSYKSIVRRNSDGTLKVQGCIMIFCRTQTWKPTK